MRFSNKNKSYISSNLIRAKELYFLNYANYGTMKRNGEYEEYVKYSVPKPLEEEWSRILINDLVKRIKTGEDVWLVSNLANIRIDEQEIIESFRIISESSNIDQIIDAISKSRPLIPDHIYDEIEKIFGVEI